MQIGFIRTLVEIKLYAETVGYLRKRALYREEIVTFAEHRHRKAFGFLGEFGYRQFFRRVGTRYFEYFTARYALFNIPRHHAEQRRNERSS